MDFERVIDRVPLLIDDKKWLQLVKDSLPEVSRQYDELVKLNNRLTEIEGELIGLKREKKRLLHNIIKVTDGHQEGQIEDEGQVDEMKGRIHEINDEIDQLQYESELLPTAIKKLNREIGIVSVRWMYELLKAGKERTEVLDLEIKTLREKLGSMYEEKFSLEAKNNEMYQYVHHLLGKEITEQLDGFYKGEEKDND